MCSIVLAIKIFFVKVKVSSYIATVLGRGDRKTEFRVPLVDMRLRPFGSTKWVLVSKFWIAFRKLLVKIMAVEWRALSHG